jgi:hypothetical protein
MPKQTLQLTSKMHELMVRACKRDSLTPSEFFIAALQRQLEIKSGVAKLITKKGTVN